ncbi:sodium-coupled monocarboxylate transporter 2 isoform X1 [Lucilia sericata]|uniref:sodium-coupled monocarboxylate transporter 2 isoform X1 n=3 Tax=Lucilia sericata TaxID=13632 RepID=UPI0018A8093E|nr:sodium-coupled monocarboxylate transporter 2 isoform X1 [Lucilia sericata]XP_037806529.1 sodium-coupled monocarboxylate transporter 2 isoform X1 [Lucilia sericata]XP_037806530.1 sodium-coupled monocarboxylate transporter 2 isoform X1 [Lucilia sericata]XP_037806532.1 sodium-coupled monocarboxylate transporter 2 isoform X1 [Lucilia sericata]XP_037806533.1 sodium-coupled monocarboxylate transporter 2 isoform X1 [Lucilia sericata]XP_037806534.1 sodium-coupled monocarboxylate transporter 2 isofo
MKEYQQFEKFHFHWADYLVFVSMIILSTSTGIYYGYFRKEKIVKELQQEDVDNKDKIKTDFGSTKMSEYLLGSRKLKIFPVAMSLVGSYVSGVTILGTVSEIYNFGTQYWLIIVSIFCMSIVVSKVYLPVFAALRVGSSYEYLEVRFSSAVRSIASIMFVMDEMFFLPIILYVPAIAFNQVTGINIHIISSVICVICVFYTLIGGIKAVVHTDAWQILVMFLSVLVVVIFGTVYAHGFGNVFQSASEGGRLIFANINPSPYDRQTLWGVLIGGFFYWTSFNSVNQTMVQRYMSLPSLKKAQCSIVIFTVGIVLFISVCCFAGLLVYNFYKDCDPLSSGLITHDDQLLPVYVMQTVGNLHGIPGLFIAGVFGAALSSLSVVLNSTALVILEDIVKGCFHLKLSEKASSILVKSCIIVLGGVAVSLVFVLEQLSGILSVATSVTAIAAGTTCGIFTLGMLVPWSNNKGALAGALAGALMSGWISFGSQIAFAQGQVVPVKLPVSVSDCPISDFPLFSNSTSSPVDESDVFPLYRLSFHWINPIGVLTTVIVGTIVSFLTGPTVVKKLDADVISPVIHRFLPKECFPPSSTDGDITRENTAQTLTYLLSDGSSKLTDLDGSTDNSEKY